MADRCQNCGIDLKEIFGAASDRPKAFTFIDATSAEITVIEEGDFRPDGGPIRCTCGADVTPQAPPVPFA